jgi:flagellar hook-length control protein FliK
MPSNALAVFAPKAPVEPTAPTQDRGIDNGSDFKDFMDNAAQKVDSPQKSSEENSAQNQNDNNTGKIKSKTKSNTQKEDSADQQEVYASKENQPNTATETVSKDSLVEDTEVLAAQLNDLDINQDQFEALLDLLGLNGDADIDTLLQSLAQALNLNQTGFGNEANSTDLIANIQRNKGEAVNLLKQAGLSEAEAKTLLNQLQSLQNASAQNEVDKNASLQAKSGSKVNQSEETDTKKPSIQKSQNENVEEPDFLTQFKDAPKETDKKDRSTLAEKLSEAPKPSGEAPRITTQEPATESGTKASNLSELLKDNNGQANLIQTESINDGKGLKGLETAKTSPDLQVQPPTVTANNAVKAVEASKPILPENLLARGATEAKIINQIADKLNVRTNGNQNEVHVKLDPPSLGTVRMKIVTSGDSVRTVIVAENQAVKQVIENNFNQLRDAMGDQGLKLDSFSVTVGGESGGQNPQQDSFEGENNHPTFEQTASNETDENPGAGSTMSLFFGDDQSISVIA